MKSFFQSSLGAFQAIGVLVAVFLLVFGGFQIGTSHVQAKWDTAEKERQQADNLAIFQRLKNNERTAEQQELDNQRMKKEHANEINQLAAAYATDRGLRISANVCTGFARSTQAEGASGSNAGTAATRPLPAETDRDLKSLGLEYETAIAGCRVAQNFIRTNGMAP